MNSPEKRSHKVPVIKVSPALGWFICTLAALFYCYEFFLRVAPGVMIPNLEQAFHVHAVQIGMMFAFYYYAYTPMQLVVGILMDRYGPRRLLTAAILACVLGSVLFVATDSLVMAEVGRLFIGFGSAFAFVGVLKLATVWLPPERFAMVSGLATMLGMLGAICGDVLLTDLVQNVGWQKSMYLAAGIGIVLAFAVWIVVRDSLPGHNDRKGDPHQFRDMKHALKAFIFVAADWRIWVNGAIGGLLFLPTTAFAATWGINYVHQVYGFSTEESGVAISMIFWGWAVGGPVAGWLSDKIKNRRLPISVGTTVAGVLLSLVIYFPDFPASLLFITLFVFGVFSSVQVIVFATACDYTLKKAAGTAIAFTNMIVMLGGVIFVPMIGWLLDWSATARGATGTTDYNAHDYRIALLLLSVGFVVTLILSFMMKETHAKPLLRKSNVS